MKNNTNDNQAYREVLGKEDFTQRRLDAKAQRYGKREGGKLDSRMSVDSTNISSSFAALHFWRLCVECFSR